MLTISDDIFFELYPAAVILTATLEVQSVGPSLISLAPGLRPGGKLTDTFSIDVVLEDHREHPRRIRLHSHDHSLSLGGTAMEAGGRFYLALRHTPDMRTLRSSNLQIADFAPDDPIIHAIMQITLLEGLMIESAELTRKLTQSNEECENLISQLNHITEFVAHEFNNILSIVKLNCAVLENNLKENSSITEPMQVIRQAAERGGSISQSLRTLSSEKDHTNLACSINETIKRNWPLLNSISGPSCILQKSLCDQDAKIECKSSYLINCFINLLFNIVSSDNDFAKVHIRTENCDDGAQDCISLVIKIQSEGRDVSTDISSQTARFFLVQGTDKLTFSDFAASLGGTFTPERISAHELAIRITLPINMPIPPSAREPSETLAPRIGTSRPHVVLVEDEADALEAMTELLEFEGYDVAPCADAQQALVALQQYQHAVLVTDVLLPQMDGIQLARVVAQSHPQVQIILMSGFIPNESERSAEWGFLQKPINVLDLKRAILNCH